MALIEPECQFEGIAPPFIHPLAEVEEGAEVGPGTKVWRFVHVRSGARVGSECILGNNVYIDTSVSIGDRVKIQNNVLVYAGVTVEDEVFLGPCMTFTNDLYPRAANPNWIITPTRVCHGASIGANATIVCGVTIGAYAMVAAGSVVTRDVPPHALVRGNPARVVGYVCECGHKIGGDDLQAPCTVHCDYCEKQVTVPLPPKR
jgi:acetyltransferase-like isoleucine patch superfamily enzyme